VQVKLPGKRAVHKDSKLEKDGGCIFEKDSIIYNCAFALCDLGCDMNQYVLVFSYILGMCLSVDCTLVEGFHNFFDAGYALCS